MTNWSVGFLLFLLANTAGRCAFAESFQYEVEWKLVRAGSAQLDLQSSGSSISGQLKLQSAGLVSRLFYVNDVYRTTMDGAHCTQMLELDAQEGKRKRQSRADMSAAAQTIHYVEKDMLANGKVVDDRVIGASACVSDLVGGLAWLRTLRMEAGQSTERWFTDGKKAAKIRVDVLGPENISTPAGRFKTIRHEVHVMNNVIFRRAGRVFIYFTNDERRLPVRIEVKMALLVGTVTLNLEKLP